MERMTLAQAVGEAPLGSPVFIPGEDFDPGDSDEVEVIRFAGEVSRADQLSRLRRENEDLSAENARLRALLGEENEEW